MNQDQEQIEWEAMLAKLPLEMRIIERRKKCGRPERKKTYLKSVELVARGERDDSLGFSDAHWADLEAYGGLAGLLLTSNALRGQFLKVHEELQIVATSITLSTIDLWPGLVGRRNTLQEKLGEINSATQFLANAAYQTPEFFNGHQPLVVVIARQREKAARAEAEAAKVDHNVDRGEPAAKPASESVLDLLKGSPGPSGVASV